MIEIDIVCPVYKQVELVKRLFGTISSQKGVVINKIVCPLTLSGDDIIDNELKSFLNKQYVHYFEVKKEDFSHSLTREKAIKEYCGSNIVILLSQDVILKDDYSLYNLCSVINEDVVYAYGKQICKKNNIEKYIREKNYGDKSFMVKKSDVDSLQLLAFFASDAFSAINREVFIRLNGYQGYDVMMNEDQLYSKIILDAGYKKMYVSNAVVEHSHKYRLRDLYKRYYETGVFYKKVKVFEQYKSVDAGLKLALYVLKEALKHFNILVLIRWLPDMTARYIGLKKGKRVK